MRRICVCADDYGLAPGVSRAIINLAVMGRLSATSVMSLSPFWPEHARWLKAHRGRLDVGLHFTLTDHAPLGPMPHLAPTGRLPSLRGLLLAALGGRTRSVAVQAEIRAECDRQTAAFIQHFGAPPAFIDGHQHIHVLAGVRDVVLALCARMPDLRVRDCWEPPGRILRRQVAVGKALVISALAWPLHNRLRENGRAINQGFSGVYDFATPAPFPRLLDALLPWLPEGGLLMVHPGLVDAVLPTLDPLCAPRQVEYDFLRSEAFSHSLHRHRLRPTRLAALFPRSAPGDDARDPDDEVDAETDAQHAARVTLRAGGMQTGLAGLAALDLLTSAPDTRADDPDADNGGGDGGGGDGGGGE